MDKAANASIFHFLCSADRSKTHKKYNEARSIIIQYWIAKRVAVSLHTKSEYMRMMEKKKENHILVDDISTNFRKRNV